MAEQFFIGCLNRDKTRETHGKNVKSITAYRHDESYELLSASGIWYDLIRYDLTKSIGISNLSILGFYADVFNFISVSRENWRQDKRRIFRWWKNRDERQIISRYSRQDGMIYCLEIVQTEREKRNSWPVLILGNSNREPPSHCHVIDQSCRAIFLGRCGYHSTIRQSGSGLRVAKRRNVRTYDRTASHHNIKYNTRTVIPSIAHRCNRAIAAYRNYQYICIYMGVYTLCIYVCTYHIRACNVFTFSVVCMCIYTYTNIVWEANEMQGERFLRI